MTPDDYRAALARLQQTQRAWAEYTGQTPVSVSRKCTGVYPVGRIEALLIEMLLKQKQD